MKKSIVYLLLAFMIITMFITSCLGPGIITDISTPVPDPDPTPVSTPTSWYIAHNFPGQWVYQFSEGGNPVQTYKVEHQGLNANGGFEFVFRNSNTDQIVLSFSGVINMNNGKIFAESPWIKIGNTEGINVNFSGTYATSTNDIEDFTCSMTERFSTDTTLRNYSIEVF